MWSRWTKLLAVALALICGAVPPGMAQAACTLPPERAIAAQLQAVNAERRRAGLPGLAHARDLSIVAQRHACDMAQRRFFSHVAPGGVALMDRLRAGNITRVCGAAENLALGQRNLGHVMRSWMASEGHRANLLNPRLTHIGFGQTAQGHWVQVMVADCADRSHRIPQGRAH